MEYAVGEAALARISLPVGSADGLEPSSRLATGDIDGDKAPDLIIGVPGADGPEGDRTDAGAVFVVPAEAIGDEEITDITMLTLHGAKAGDNLGFSVAAGDLNGDGVEDVIAGATGSNGIPDIRTDMGEVLIVFGGSEATGVRDMADREFDALLQPAEGFSHLGSALATGDLDGDGVDDLAAGAPFAGRVNGSPVGGPRTTVGEVYVIHGSSDLSGVLTVADGDEDSSIAGAAEFDQFGHALLIDDLDDDIENELIIGSPGFDQEAGPQNTGAAFIFGPSALAERATTADADLVVFGSVEAGQFGETVGVANEAVIAGAPTEGTPERPGCGSVRAGDAPIIGSSSGEFFPAALGTVALGGGDLILAASPRHNGGAGALFVLEPPMGTVDLVSPPPGSRVLTGTEAEGLGVAVVPGEFDGDPGREVAVMAQSATSANNAGAVYIVDV